MDQVAPFPGAVFGLVMAVYLIVIIGFTVLMMIVCWRTMRAHENIAERMGGIERALSARAGDSLPPR